MLNKFAHLSPFLRLSLCLIFSSGLHAGVANFDWLSQAGLNSVGEPPVVVTFLPADDHAPAKPVDRSSVAKPKPVKKKIVNRAAAQKIPVKPIVEPPQIVPKDTQQKELQVVKSDKLPEKSLAADLVCVDPQQDNADQQAEAAADDAITLTGHREDVTGAAVQKVGALSAKEDIDGVSQGRPADVMQEAIPKYRINPKPEYPYVAAKRRWEGVVWLLVDVSSEGLVNDLTVEQSCGYRVLDRAASRSVKRWEFVPAMRAGLPVESQVRIPVRFRLEDG